MTDPRSEITEEMLRADGLTIYQDDGLITLYESFVQCSMCGRWGEPQDVPDGSYLGDSICLDCRPTLYSRVRSLEKNNRNRWCPTRPEDFIFSPDSHNGSLHAPKLSYRQWKKQRAVEAQANARKHDEHRT